MPETNVASLTSRKNALVFSLFFIVALLAASDVAAQGWLRYYPTYAFNVSHMNMSPNGDHVLAGTSIDSGQTHYYFFVQRNDVDGNFLWDRDVRFPGQTDAWCTFSENCPGGGIVSGGAATIGGLRRQAIFRLSDAGDTLWTRIFSPDQAGHIFAATPTPDGNLLVSGNRRGGPNDGFSPTLTKINPADGSVIWSKFYPNHPGNEFGGGTLIAPDGSILHTSSNDTAFVRRMDADGNLLWERNVLPVYFSDYGIMRRALPDGFTWMQRQGDEMFFRRYDYDGNLLSAKLIPDMGYSLPASTQFDEGYAFAVGGFFAGTDTFPKFRKIDFAGNTEPAVFPLAGLSTGLIFWAQTVEGTPDGGFLIAGGTIGQASVFVLKIDSSGQFGVANMAGRVFRDDNADCLETSGETGLHPIVLQATDLDFGGQWYETTVSGGDYLFTVPTGDYEVEVLAPGGASGYWGICPPLSVSLPAQGDTANLAPLGLQALYDCPYLQLDMAAGIFRPCSTTVVTVLVQNVGPADADSAVVLLEFDPLLTYYSSSIPPLVQNGQLLQFDLGALASLQDTVFQVYFTVDCAAETGQAICIDGHVSPDSLCAPPDSIWDGAELRVEVLCDGDSVRFQVQNIGAGDMGAPSELVIIEDYIILRTVPLQLGSGQDTVISLPGNDQTYYARIAQTDGYPGFSISSDGKEFCTGAGTTGMLLQYPVFSGGPFDATFCDEVRTSFDPNDKRGFPLGYGPSHYIDRDVPIRYMIRFQNTGNDTAFNVVVRDSLPAQLDPATLRVGSASHPFEWTLSGQGYLTFRFPGILLPDSTTNEPASHGFVQFSILPKTGLPPATPVQNRAAIYFDYNAPVFTEYAWHTIDSNFVPLHVLAPKKSWFAVNISPNPASRETTLEWENLSPGDLPLTLSLCDVLGRTLREERVWSKKHTLRRENLPAGICFVKTSNNRGMWLGTCRLVWVSNE